MRRVGQMDVHRPAAASVAQVVQHPMGGSAAASLVPAERTAPSAEHPAALLDPRRRQVLHPHHPFGFVRNIIARADHGRSSRRSASGVIIGQSASPTLEIRNNDATVSVLRVDPVTFLHSR